ncbi:hypothetical protein EMO91_11820 [Bifidobacterium myosotis]|nr:hypothetical protein EMO91_11820 [Bifidobacterium myosotis]
MSRINTLFRKLSDAIIVTALSGTMLAVGLPANIVQAEEPLFTSQSSSSNVPASTADMTGDVIYQLITDRFYDGDSSNNNPASAIGEYSADRTNWQLYWGGDFAGVAEKMSYLKNLGVGAIWISPPVQNISSPVTDSSGLSAGYH